MTTNTVDPTIMPVRPGTLSDEDKKELRAAGIIVIEHENPSEIRLIKPYAEISGDKLLMAALNALKPSAQSRDRLATMIIEMITAEAA